MTRNGPDITELLAAVARERVIVAGDPKTRLQWLQLWAASQARRDKSHNGRNAREAWERRGVRVGWEYCWCCARWAPCGTHHIVQLSRGGNNDPRNLVRLCRRCHLAVHPGVLVRRAS